jgi:hypothetical protein
VLARQHVWVGPETTSFAAPCEACLEGELRLDADVGFSTCARGHRVVVRRLGVDARKRRRSVRKAMRNARHALT